MTNARRRSLIAIAVAGLAAGAGTAWWRSRDAEQDERTAALWTLRLPGATGGELDMSAWRNHRVVLNFWATWCPPCVRELPLLDRFQRDFGPQGWQVLGIAVDRPEPVREFLARTPLSFPSGLAGFEGIDIARKLGNESSALPFTVVFGRDGRALHRKLGETNYRELAGWAKQA